MTTMNRLLNIENRVSNNSTNARVNFRLNRQAINALPNRQTHESVIHSTMKYLPIVGILRRASTDKGIPLVPISLLGVYKGRNRLDFEEMISERKTDGKGHFILLLRYNSSVENQLSDAVVHLQVAGQDRVFKIPMISYNRGMFEIESILGKEKKKQLFNRLGIPGETKLLMDKQLSYTSIAEITIN